MRIRMKRLLAGPKGIMHDGKEYNVDDVFGTALVEGGVADAVTAPEAAVIAQPEESAVQPEAQPRRSKKRAKRKG